MVGVEDHWNQVKSIEVGLKFRFKTKTITVSFAYLLKIKRVKIPKYYS